MSQSLDSVSEDNLNDQLYQMFTHTFEEISSNSLSFSAQLSNSRKSISRFKSAEIIRRHHSTDLQVPSKETANDYFNYKILHAGSEFYSRLPNYQLSEMTKNVVF